MTAGLHGALRVLRRSAIELALVAAGAWCGNAALVFIVWSAAVAGLVVLLRKGELHLALLCPRLDALGLRLATRKAPWQSLTAAEAALRALDHEVGHFREFFPEARRDLVNAAARALESQRNLTRAEAALVFAPQGESRALLEAQRERAARELERLTGSLRDLRARLVASTQPLPATADPANALRALEERSRILSSELVGGDA
jgi:hypothetical protein